MFLKICKKLSRPFIAQVGWVINFREQSLKASRGPWASQQQKNIFNQNFNLGPSYY